ncbi:MAG: hypothetical protein QOD81_3098 [Solirubrobacteraceae bacterium]|jgi:hypothetical protein|nr:hypothetical protein [Solirubrobacteraceae bacterium]
MSFPFPTLAQLRPTAIAVALVAAPLGAPGVAAAADLTATGTCFAEGQPVAVSGTAFTPGAPVDISGAASGVAQTNAMGAFTTEITAPGVTGMGPKRARLRFVDRTNPANTSVLAFKVVHEAFGSNRPVAGAPRAKTTWRFAGFARGQPIYGHFVLDGRSRGDYRFGVARGDCGTLRVRARRIPGVADPRPGSWQLKLDQRMTYRADAPGSVVNFRIHRRPGR